MPDYLLTTEDLEWLRECYLASREECDSEGWEYEGEVCCTSIGYVDLQSDGDIVGYGQLLGSVGDDQY